MKKVLARVFRMPESDVLPDLTKDDIGMWDSLRQMELVTSLEKEFGVVLEAEDIVRMVSFRDVCDVLVAKGARLEC